MLDHYPQGFKRYKTSVLYITLLRVKGKTVRFNGRLQYHMSFHRLLCLLDLILCLVIHLKPIQN